MHVVGNTQLSSRPRHQYVKLLLGKPLHIELYDNNDDIAMSISAGSCVTYQSPSFDSCSIHSFDTTDTVKRATINAIIA